MQLTRASPASFSVVDKVDQRHVLKRSSSTFAFKRSCPTRANRSQIVIHSASSGTGGNVIDKPKTTPGIERKKQTRKAKSPIYRVILHNDNYNKREYVVSVIMKVVEGYTVDEAVNVMQEAHIYGFALVTQCGMEDAERYCEGMRSGGLIATMEPAGP